MSLNVSKHQGESELTVFVRFQMFAALFPLRALVAELRGEGALSSCASLLETPELDSLGVEWPGNKGGPVGGKGWSGC